MFFKEGKPLIKLPSGLKTPSSPSNKNYARFGNMFTATSAVNKNYRKEPNFESIMTDFSPTNWRKSSSSSSVEAKSSTKKKPCGSNFWKETETLYFVGYIWVPSGTKTLEFNTGADDRGFIYINGERVAKRSCCKVTKTKVNVKNSKIKTNSWNLVFGTGADG